MTGKRTKNKINKSKNIRTLCLRSTYIELYEKKTPFLLFPESTLIQHVVILSLDYRTGYEGQSPIK